MLVQGRPAATAKQSKFALHLLDGGVDLSPEIRRDVVDLNEVAVPALRVDAA